MTVLDWDQDAINQSKIRKTKFDDFIKQEKHSNLDVLVQGKPKM